MRAAMVVSCYPLGTSTILLNIVKLLRLRGVNLDIIIDQGSLANAPLQMPDDGIRIITPEQTLWQRLKRKLLPHSVRLSAEKSGLGALYADYAAWVNFALWAGKLISKSVYDVVFFASYPALFTVGASTAKSCNIYLNLELLDADDSPVEYGNKALLRTLEHTQLTKIHRVIAMSPRRREIFLKITGFSHDAVKVLPIMPMDGLRPRTGTYFRDHFGIAPETYLVLYSGGIASYGQHLELLQTVRHWPRNCALVMHTWCAASFETKYGLALRKAGEGLPVYFSSETLNYKALCEAITSADIGVAHYKDIDSNFTEILFSSNKIGEYLCSGLPIICSPQPSLKQFVDANGIGQALPVEQTPQALYAIMSDLERYRCAVRRCVERHFDFNEWFEQALGDLLPKENIAL